MDLIQVDSVDVESSKELPGEGNINSLGILYPGQRMDFILRPRHDAGHQSSMGIQLDQEYENTRYPMTMDSLLISKQLLQVHQPGIEPRSNLSNWL